MKGNSSLSFTFQIFRFALVISIHLEAHPKHQEPEPYLAISRLRQQNEYGHTLHCKLRGLKVSHHATCSKESWILENRNRHIERDVCNIAERRSSRSTNATRAILIQILFERRGNCSFNHAQLRKQCKDARCPNQHKTFRKIVK